MIRNLCWAAGLLLLIPVAQADIYNLTDLNTSATIDTTFGQTDWYVNGVNQLSEQSFWYRANGDTQEYMVGSLPHTATPYGTDRLDVDYTGAGFSIKVAYDLTGVGSGAQADLNEVIRVTNDSNHPLRFSFFQFANFDLAGTADFDTVQFLSGTNVVQTDLFGPNLSETFSSNSGATAVYRMADLASTIRGLLSDGDIDDLVNQLSYGPGDAAWAVQWTITLPAYGSLLISKDKLLTIVPAPGAAFLAVLGLGMLRSMRRRIS